MPDVKKPVSTYEPKKESIGQLLSMNEPSIIVPDWQRNYSWKAEQVDTFWNDLEKFSSRQGDDIKGEYFLGSVVIVNTESGELKLLDGQQRLATSAILLSVIRDRAMKHNKNAADQLHDNYLKSYDHVEERVVHKLRLNIYDRDFFRQLVLDKRGGEYIEPSPIIPSHHLMYGARKKLTAHIETCVEGLSEEDAFKKCMAISRVLLKHMTVIAVYSSDEENAADVFETLNDRGIGLSTPDLLRNLIIRRAPSGTQDTIVELWRDLISFESDIQIQNFLRHYWVSRYGDVKTQSLYREIKSVILDKDLDSLELSTSLNSSSEVYRQLTTANTPSENLNKLLSEILDYGSKSRLLFPSLLALVEEVGFDDAVEIINTVHNVFVRYSIILNLENSPLEKALYDAARELRNKPDLKKFSETVINVAPTDEAVTTAFKTLALKHNGSRRNLLKRFELELRATEELDIANPSRVHVEHVYPQKPRTENKIENHDRVINRLGNLTLLSARLNRKIQNGAFSEKQPDLAKSELLMTKEIAKSNSWGVAEISERQNTMADIAPKLWPIS